ncbi:MAG: elongation factor P, partial [Pseudomonadota bacterium]
MVKISCNDIRPGNVLEHRDKLWMVVKTEHVKPGKGPAYQQVELKGVEDTTKLNERFRAADTVERVRLDEAPFQYLYDDGDNLNFMNQESFEQIALNRDLVGDPAVFLQEGMVCSVQTYEGRPLGVTLPDTVVCEIVEADPVVKGQTAAAS